MRGSVPSLGALSSFAPQPPSRIPHLKLHILARRPRNKAAQVPERTRPSQRRCFHTISPSYSLSGILLETSQRLDQTQKPPTPATNTRASVETQNVETHSNLEEILQEAHPERVLYTLLSTAEGRRFVVQAPTAKFEAAFCSIDPRFMLESFKDIYRYMKPSLATQPRYRWVRTTEERLETFAEYLDEIVSLRRSRHQLTKDVCTHLLHCARVLGDGPMARQVWQILIPEDGLQHDLDVHAYNCYTEAICWSNAFSEAEQWRLRVTPRILGIRRANNPPPDLSGHRTGPLGLRHETLVYFRRMVGQMLDGNEETFTNLMIAMGREGDIAGAMSILKSVYNIDVDLLLEVDEEEVETPTFYELDSPLRPTARLLYTIAHVFGSNNDIGLAFKLVDFVSRQYDLRIPFNVWMHLFDWAFVLSLRRSGAKRRQGQATGQVPHAIIDTLWTEMTDEPHNIQPDVVMHTRRARSMRDRGMLRESLDSIQAAKTLFEGSRGDAERLGVELLAVTDQILTTQPPASPLQVVPAEWFDLRRQFILSSLIEDRDLQLLIVTVRLTLTENNWLKDGRHEEWERRRLPDLIADYTEYLPNTLAYRTRAGLIEMTGLKSARVGAARSGMAMSRRNGLLRTHIEKEIATVEDLFAAIQMLRAEVDEIERTGCSVR